MAIGPYWHVVLAAERTNVLTNPSGETGTATWGTVHSGTVGTTSQYQRFGAWAGSVAPTSNGTSGAHFGAWTAGAGTDYTISAYVRGVNGVPYILAAADTSNANLVGSVAFTGGGTWQRYSFSYNESAGASRRVLIRKNSSADTSAFYVDGVQVEAGSLTTYVDGDQDGCIWLGQSHTSASYRGGQVRAGGSVVTLSSLGFAVETSTGIGMPPLDTSFQSYAQVAGGEFQRQRADIRTFTLTSTASGSTWPALHIQRRTFLNAVKTDRNSPQQPTRFLYGGAEGTVSIDAVLTGGGEFGQSAGFSEVLGLTFTAADPYWSNVTTEGTALASRVNLGSTNYIAYRDPLGRWGTLGVNGTTIDATGVSAQFTPIQRMLYHPSGTLFFAGTFSKVGGTTYPHLGLYYPATNTFGTLTGGTVNAIAYTLALTPSGSLYIGGVFTNVAGTGPVISLAQWNGAFGTLIGGSVTSGYVDAILYAPTGTTFFAGSFSHANGTVSPHLGMYANGAIGTLTGGTTVASEVQALAYSRRNILYFAGPLSTVGNTITSPGIGQWNGAFGSLTSGLASAGVATPQGRALLIASDQRLYVAGLFGSAGGGSATDAAVWNGVQFSALGSGFPDASNNTQCLAVAEAPNTNIYFGGTFNGTAGGVPINDGLAIWNGYSFLPADIALPVPGANRVRDILFTPTGTMYISSYSPGTAQAAAVAQVINTGMAPAYPTLRIRNPSSGTARVYQLLNTTTGDGLFFNLNLAAGEEVSLTMQPTKRSFVSSFFGPIPDRILRGSNQERWRLLPGTNYVSFFADNDSLVTSFYWTPVHESADGGTVA